MLSVWVSGLTELPPEIGKFFRLTVLRLEENPMTSPPGAIVGQVIADILQDMRESER